MAAKLKDGVFLGDYEAAQDLEFIVANKITHIINCAGREIPNGWERSGIKYLTYYWPENGACVIFDEHNAVLDEIFTFIESTIEVGESVLVHSIDGVSRACFCCAVYFMLRYKWTLEKTLMYLQSKRPDLMPRPAFIRHLTALDYCLRRVTHAQGASEEALQRYSTWDVALVASAPDAEQSDELLLTNTFLNSQPASEADLQSAPELRDKSTTLVWLDQVPGQGAGPRPNPERPPTPSYSAVTLGPGWVDTHTGEQGPPHNHAKRQGVRSSLKGGRRAMQEMQSKLAAREHPREARETRESREARDARDAAISRELSNREAAAQARDRDASARPTVASLSSVTSTQASSSSMAPVSSGTSWAVAATTSASDAESSQWQVATSTVASATVSAGQDPAAATNAAGAQQSGGTPRRSKDKLQPVKAASGMSSARSQEPDASARSDRSDEGLAPPATLESTTHDPYRHQEKDNRWVSDSVTPSAPSVAPGGEPSELRSSLVGFGADTGSSRRQPVLPPASQSSTTTKPQQSSEPDLLPRPRAGSDSLPQDRFTSSTSSLMSIDDEPQTRPRPRSAGLAPTAGDSYATNESKDRPSSASARVGRLMPVSTDFRLEASRGSTQTSSVQDLRAIPPSPMVNPAHSAWADSGGLPSTSTSASVSRKPVAVTATSTDFGTRSGPVKATISNLYDAPPTSATMTANAGAGLSDRERSRIRKVAGSNFDNLSLRHSAASGGWVESVSFTTMGSTSTGLSAAGSNGARSSGSAASSSRSGRSGNKSGHHAKRSATPPRRWASSGAPPTPVAISTSAASSRSSLGPDAANTGIKPQPRLAVPAPAPAPVKRAPSPSRGPSPYPTATMQPATVGLVGNPYAAGLARHGTPPPASLAAQVAAASAGSRPGSASDDPLRASGTRIGSAQPKRSNSPSRPRWQM